MSLIHNNQLKPFGNQSILLARSRKLVQNLIQPQCYNHPVDEIRLIETHISWVILTGRFAYKIKKPVLLDFLDFSTLEKRYFYCQREIKLNQRFSPDIYLGISNISGSPENPLMDFEQREQPEQSEQSKKSIIEYAVKMRQFSQSSQLDQMLFNGELQSFHVDAFADLIAMFHQNITIAEEDNEFGNFENILRPVDENFSMLTENLKDKNLNKKINDLHFWSTKTAKELKPLFSQRKRDGFIRECHGDLHLRNMAWVNQNPVLFDCIEFDDNLTWIDVISEVAFLYMDLQENDCYQLASRFLNRYLENTGDYSGVRLLRFYLCYRAMVRAKIASIEITQSVGNSSRQLAAKSAFQKYLLQAEKYTRLVAPRLIITHGFSACGKTTISQQLLEQMNAIRIRSDVERKRLFGMQANENVSADIDQSIYTSESNKQTYDKLLELAGVILDSGFSVIVDATFLKFSQRKHFQHLAAVKKVPYIILDITARASSLRQRIEQREKGASDATRAVLEHQLENTQEVHDEEISHVIVVDTEVAIDFETLSKKISLLKFANVKNQQNT